MMTHVNLSANDTSTYLLFVGTQCLAQGGLNDVVRTAKRTFDQEPAQQLLVFDASTSEQIDLNLHGSEADVLARLSERMGGDKQQRTLSLESGAESEAIDKAHRLAGRPKLGVVGREVTLLPRHWEWLASQPGGASVALRKLVEQALRANRDQDRARKLRDAAYRFIYVMAGNEPGFEEATRALFGMNQEQFHKFVKCWPKDVQAHATHLADRFFASNAPTDLATASQSASKE